MSTRTGAALTLRKPDDKREPEPAPQPHDRLFKWVFSRREHAAGFLRAVLPAALLADIDFRTLRLEEGSSIDRALRSRYSDLLFSARLRGRTVYFYVLIEHQRDIEPLMIVRMGIYMMRLWDRLLRDHPDLAQIPGIFPILVHHSTGGWTAATAFQDVVALEDAVRPALLPYTPCFQAHLIDLREDLSAVLRMESLTPLGQLALWLLSVAGDDGRLRQGLIRLGAALTQVLRAPDAAAALEVLLRYLLATHRSLSVEEITDIMEDAAGPEGQEVIMTVLDEIEERGRTEGLEQGRTQGRAQTLLEQLTARFGQVPARTRARIHAADEATLARWSLRVLSAPTLKDVLDTATPPRPPTKPATRRR